MKYSSGFVSAPVTLTSTVLVLMMISSIVLRYFGVMVVLLYM